MSSAVVGLLGRLLSMASRDHFAVILRCREGKASTEESCQSPLQLVSDRPGTSTGVGIPPCDNQTTRALYQRCHKLSRKCSICNCASRWPPISDKCSQGVTIDILGRLQETRPLLICKRGIRTAASTASSSVSERDIKRGGKG